MVKEVRIDTIDGIFQILNEQEYQPDLKRYRSSYVYRGLGSTKYRMTTSLKRNCKDKARLLEPSILRTFAKYASGEDAKLKASVWRQMVMGQHHGLPTRLLDFTHSPLIALHFAAVKELAEHEHEDCIVWRIDMSELHNLLPHNYKSGISDSRSRVINMDEFEALAPTIEAYDEDMGSNCMVIVEPQSIDERIVNQYSFFGIVPSEMDSVEEFLDKKTNNTVKYIISADLRWQIADVLDAFNISERIIYPGLDGLSAWIARHYCVRDDK